MSESLSSKTIKQREYSRAYRQRNLEKERERVRNDRRNMTDEQRLQYNAKMREWTAKNKDRLNEERRNRRKNDNDYAEAVRARDRARNPEQRRAARLKRDYGITLDDYNVLLHKQGHKCAICGADESDSLGRNFHVDHCHTSGAVRGLLCTECNTGLGKFKDNIDVLSKAIEYLKG